MIEGADGNLYGTTLAGGTGGVGTPFLISKAGTGFAVLHSLASFDSANGYC